MPVRTYVTVVAFALSFAACQDGSRPVDTGSNETATQRTGPEVVPGQYIVVFSDRVADPGSVATALVRSLGGTMLHTSFWETSYGSAGVLNYNLGVASSDPTAVPRHCIPR